MDPGRSLDRQGNDRLVIEFDMSDNTRSPEKPLNFDSHKVGALVLPAQNGSLFELGYNLESLGSKGLGVILEVKPRGQSVVVFAELGISYQLKNSELADLDYETKHNPESPFAKFYQTAVQQKNLSLQISKLIQKIKPIYLLNFERSDELVDLFQGDLEQLKQFFSGPHQIPCLYLGLGVEEFHPSQMERLQKDFENLILFYRVLPSGMHKLELSLYLKI